MSGNETSIYSGYNKSSKVCSFPHPHCAFWLIPSSSLIATIRAWKAELYKKTAILFYWVFNLCLYHAWNSRMMEVANETSSIENGANILTILQWRFEGFKRYVKFTIVLTLVSVPRWLLWSAYTLGLRSFFWERDQHYHTPMIHVALTAHWLFINDTRPDGKVSSKHVSFGSLRLAQPRLGSPQ